MEGTSEPSSIGGIRFWLTVNAAPVVAITAPPDATTVVEGAPLTLTGTATDAEDGDLSASLAWSSSVDGALGTGASVPASTLSVGVHTITASVTDSLGLGGSDQITLTVTANAAPVVTITAPPDATTVGEGLPVTLTGTATDREDGDLSAGLAWSSDLDGALGSGASVVAAALSAGVHTLTASVTDSGGRGGSAQITLTVTAGVVLVQEIPVSASSDDAAERASESMIVTSTDLELVLDNVGNQTVGLRFNGVAVPPGATILNADVQFQADEVNTVATSLTIEGEAVDDAATFIDIKRSISSRPRTTAAVSWSPPPWTPVGEAGPDQRTSDISSVIQEIVNRPGWSHRQLPRAHHHRDWRADGGVVRRGRRALAHRGLHPLRRRPAGIAMTYDATREVTNSGPGDWGGSGGHRPG